MAIPALVREAVERHAALWESGSYHSFDIDQRQHSCAEKGSFVCAVSRQDCFGRVMDFGTHVLPWSAADNVSNDLVVIGSP